MARQGALDGVAAGLSSLCLVHCLTLPLLLVMLPMFGSATESLHGPAWVHWALLAIAAPFSFYALRRGAECHHDRRFWYVAIVGFAFMVAGALSHTIEPQEQVLTVVGGLIVAAAHWMNWKARLRA